MAGDIKEVVLSRRSVGLSAIGLALVIFLAFNMVANLTFTSWRLDLTEDGLYSTSEGTEHVLESLDEPITLRFFFSERAAASYPGIFRYGRRVRDMLQEFAAIAGDKIDLRIIDPEPFSDEEDEAVAAGMQGIPTTSGETIFLGLAASDTTDRRTVIPYFAEDRESVLEYELAKLIDTLSSTDRVSVGLMTSLPMQFGPGGIQAFAQGRGQPYALYQMLQDGFEVENLDAGVEKIPDTISVLLIVHPGNLSDATLYAIDQYVLGGGRAIVLVDPYSEASANIPPPQGGFGGPAPVPEQSDLARLFEAWGVSYDSGRVVGDLELAQRVNMGGGGARAVRDYIIWIGANQSSMNQDDIVTGRLDFMNFATAGAIAHVEGATTTFEPLIQSSSASGLIDAMSVRFSPDPDQLIQDLVVDELRYTLAARLSGPAISAFPDGSPNASNGELEENASESADRPVSEAETSHLSAGDINVLIAADTDFIDDRFWIRIRQIFGQRIAEPFAQNGAFVINAVDHLAGSEDLISLRSRGISQRPFEVVEDIRREAEALFLAEEQALQSRLDEAEARIIALESPDIGSEFLTSDQEAEIEGFRQQVLDTRQQLRTVQRNLRQDVESLGTRLAFLNIALVPLLLVMIALVRGRRKRRGSGS